MFKFLLRPLDRWVRRIVHEEARRVDITIQNLEVASDDPDRFVAQLLEAINQSLMDPPRN